jgi:hypothetical protein
MNYINLYIFIVSYFLILLVSKLILLDIPLIHTHCLFRFLDLKIYENKGKF